MAAVQDSTTNGQAPGPRQAGAPAQRPPAQRPVLDRGRGQLLGITLAQVVAWQVAAAAVLIGLVRDDWARWIGVAVAVVIAVFTLPRVGGRWLYQWLAVRARFWWRVASPVTDPAVDPRLAPLRELLPELDVTTTQGRGGAEIGVIQDGQAWVAVVGIRAADTILPLAQPVPLRVPVRSLAGVLSVDDVRLAAVQVLTHTVPAPSGLLGVRSGPAVSYQQLSSGQVPAAQLTWVALRLDPALCPDAVAARGGGLDGIHRALRRCIARTVEVLESAGVSCRALDGEGARTALSLSAGVLPRHQGPPGARRTGEDWRSWTCDGVAHVTYWLGGWPADPARGVPALLDRLGAVPTLFTTVSLTLTERTAERVRFHGMVRLSCATGDTMARAASAFGALASAAGFRAVRLDGEHAPAALATMPLGGGAP